MYTDWGAMIGEWHESHAAPLGSCSQVKLTASRSFPSVSVPISTVSSRTNGRNDTIKDRLFRFHFIFLSFPACVYK